MNVRNDILAAEARLSGSEVLEVRGASPRNVSASRHVITLASLSRLLPGRLIADTVAKHLHCDTRDSVLVIQIDCPETPVSLRDFAAIQSSLNGEFCFSDSVQDESGVKRLALRMTGDSEEAAFLKPMLEHCGHHFRHVLLYVGADVPGQKLFECLSQSDASYVFAEQTSESLYQCDLVFREARIRLNGDVARLKAALCLREGERAQLSAEFSRTMGAPLHCVVHGCPQPTENNGSLGHLSVFEGDLRRLAREIGRCRLGLALSAGGAKGLAHIGIIQVLEENGIEVDVVAGCSMGAYVAAAWGYGCNGKEMEKLAREVEGRWGVWRLVDPVFPPREGFIRGRAVKRRLQRTIGDIHFSELTRPIRVVATNLYTLDRAVFSSGDVASAVHASIAIPGVCAPVMIDGETYVDGGIADPLPVDVLEEMGVDRIIAVNTIPTPAYMRCCMEMEREQEELHGRRHRFLKALNRQVNYFAPGNILDIMMRAVHGSQIRVAEEACLHADIVLRPLGMDARWYEFDKPVKYIAIGRRVAEEHLEEIRSLANGRTSAYEPQTADNTVAAIA